VKSNAAPEEKKETDGLIDGPGSQLRTARESLGLEQAKVAAQLHLSQSMIHALEWDDYQKLPTAVFVQGYLRNYARLLGVNVDAVIRSYQDLNPHPDPEPLPRNQPDDVAKQLHESHRLVRFATWVVFVLLAAPLFMWWQGRMDLPGPETTPTATVSEKLPPEDGPSADVPPEISSESPVTPQKTTSVVEESTAPIASGKVVFEFSGPCWVEVHDTIGRTRLIGEMRAGLRRTLDAGLGPFQIVLGDINSVSVSANGTTIDLRSHARGKVARFTLDPSRL